MISFDYQLPAICSSWTLPALLNPDLERTTSHRERLMRPPMSPRHFTPITSGCYRIAVCSLLCCCVTATLAAVATTYSAPSPLKHDPSSSSFSGENGLSGLYNGPLTSEYAYSYRRNKLVAAMEATSFDLSARTHMTDHERVADRYLTYLKTLWLGGRSADESAKVDLPDHGSPRPQPAHGTAQDVYSAIRNTSLFATLALLPKGANLGVRGGLVPPSLLLQEFHSHPNLYYSPTIRAIGFFTSPPLSFEPASTASLAELLDILTVPASISTAFFTGGVPPSSRYRSQSQPDRDGLNRDALQRYTLRSRPFWQYDQVWRRNIELTIEAAFEQGLNYIELRMPLGMRYTLDTPQAATTTNTTTVASTSASSSSRTADKPSVVYDGDGDGEEASTWFPNSTIVNTFGQRLVDPTGESDIDFIRRAQKTFGTKHTPVQSDSQGQGVRDEGWSGVGVRVISSVSFGESTDVELLTRLTAFKELRRSCASPPSSSAPLTTSTSSSSQPPSSSSPSTSTSTSTLSTSSTSPSSSSRPTSPPSHLDNRCPYGDNSDMLVGVEFCGDEALSRPFFLFSSSLIRVFQRLSSDHSHDLSALHREFPVVICAGENIAAPVDMQTDIASSGGIWSTPTDNAIDALLLGARRVTNPLVLALHPHLLKAYADERVPIELSPLLNAELGFTPVTAAHPFHAMAATDALIVLTSDAGAAFGHSDFTFDWVLAFTRWGLTLPGLKTLALNSIRSALVTESERWRLLDKWESQWNDWVNGVVRQACTLFPNHMYPTATSQHPQKLLSSAPIVIPRRTLQLSSNQAHSETTSSEPSLLLEPELTTVFPTAGPREGGYPVLLRGKHLDSAICSVFVCRFGRHQSTALGIYRGANALECHAPPAPSTSTPSNLIPASLPSSSPPSSSLTGRGDDGSMVDWDASTHDSVLGGTAVYLRWSPDGGRTFVNRKEVTFTYVDMPLDPDATPSEPSLWSQYQVIFVASIVGSFLLIGAVIAWRCLRGHCKQNDRLNLNAETVQQTSGSTCGHDGITDGSGAYPQSQSYQRIDMSNSCLPYDLYPMIPVMGPVAITTPNAVTDEDGERTPEASTTVTTATARRNGRRTMREQGKLHGDGDVANGGDNDDDGGDDDDDNGGGDEAGVGVTMKGNGSKEVRSDHEDTALRNPSSTERSRGRWNQLTSSRGYGSHGTRQLRLN